MNSMPFPFAAFFVVFVLVAGFIAFVIIGTIINIDSRPSDAIALGIAGNVPIYVAEHVLNSAMKDDGSL